MYVRARDFFRRNGDRQNEGRMLNNLGIVYRSQGRRDEAISAYDDALVIGRESKDRVGEGQTLENVALLWEAQGDVSRALPFARQAVAELECAEAKANLEKARRTLAWLEAAQG